jgi:hypothetical protein
LKPQLPDNLEFLALLQIYQQELEELERSREEHVKELDFKAAHRLRKSIALAKRQIDILVSIDDPHYKQREFLLKHLAEMEALHKQNERAWKERWPMIKAHYEAELAKLEKPSVQQEENVILPELVQRLMDRKISDLTVVLHQAKNIVVKFRFLSGTLRIRLIGIGKDNDGLLEGDETLRQFFKLGFIKRGGGYVLEITGSRDFVLEEFNRSFSILVFEVLGHKMFRGESFLSYRERGK